MPEDFAQIWIDLLRKIESAGLYDTILYVDFCNEFPNWLDCAPKGETAPRCRATRLRRPRGQPLHRGL